MCEKCSAGATLLLAKTEPWLLSCRNLFPNNAPVTIWVNSENIAFHSGSREFANVHVINDEVLEKMSRLNEVGIIEFPKGKPNFPAYISIVASVKKISQTQKVLT